MLKKTIASLLITLFLAFPIHTAHAGFWGENFLANTMKQMLEEISVQIRDAIFAAAKMAAIKQATSTIEDLLYGENSSPRNINNYHTFLIEDSRDTATTYAKDFLTNTLRGTASGDYTPIGGSGSDPLSKALQQAGAAVVTGMNGDTAVTVNYSEFCGDTSNFFADGNFKCFSAIMSNPVNTPVGMALAVDQIAAAKYKQEKEKAKLLATSTGVLPQIDENGNVTLPTSVVEAIQLQQVTLPLEALANGDNKAFSMLIKSLAVQMITDIINNGLSSTEESNNKNMDAYKRQYGEEVGKDRNPGSEYSSDPYSSSQKDKQSQQDAKPWVNPDL